eukprot:SAG11_NODE_2497_length_3289_cov_9.558307_2_plen_94_part_00
MFEDEEPAPAPKVSAQNAKLRVAKYNSKGEIINTQECLDDALSRLEINWKETAKSMHDLEQKSAPAPAPKPTPKSNKKKKKKKKVSVYESSVM